MLVSVSSDKYGNCNSEILAKICTLSPDSSRTFLDFKIADLCIFEILQTMINSLATDLFEYQRTFLSYTELHHVAAVCKRWADLDDIRKLEFHNFQFDVHSKQEVKELLQILGSLRHPSTLGDGKDAASKIDLIFF